MARKRKTQAQKDDTLKPEALSPEMSDNQEEAAPPAPQQNADETQEAVTTDNEPAENGGTNESPKEEAKSKHAEVSEALKASQGAREAIRKVAHQHPDMIEARQALDALDEANGRIGQIVGLLESK